jgi:integrase
MTAGEVGAHLERYLGLRRALGFAMRAEERLLRAFVGCLAAHALPGPIRAQVALDWACATAGRCGPGGQARRLTVARGFLVYLRATDPGVEVPEPGLLARAVRPQPHIYTEREIAALLGAARRLGPPGALRPHTLATLIGLLVSCGLRASEALRLQLTDVDLAAAPPCLHVRQTKFRKSRLVPLHPTTAAALRAYAEYRRRLGYDGQGEHFFASERGGPLNYHVTARTFVALARSLGLRGPVGTPGASLRSLRHTFAVRRLLAWYREGADVHGRLPVLAIYLGHVWPRDTYWYLTATPELLRAAADRFEAHARVGAVR